MLCIRTCAYPYPRSVFNMKVHQQCWDVAQANLFRLLGSGSVFWDVAASEHIPTPLLGRFFRGGKYLYFGMFVHTKIHGFIIIGWSSGLRVYLYFRMLCNGRYRSLSVFWDVSTSEDTYPLSRSVFLGFGWFCMCVGLLGLSCFFKLNWGSNVENDVE